jgi:hypothetical protein
MACKTGVMGQGALARPVPLHLMMAASVIRDPAACGAAGS